MRGKKKRGVSKAASDPVPAKPMPCPVRSTTYAVIYLDEGGLNIYQKNDIRPVLRFIAHSRMDRSEYVLMAGEIVTRPPKLISSNKIQGISDDNDDENAKGEHESFIVTPAAHELRKFIHVHPREDYSGNVVEE